MIIYLNGTSSSGKSSIALELQDKIEAPVFYFSIDTLLYSLNKKTLDAIQGKSSCSFNIDWNNIFQSYFDCVRMLDKSSHIVIADCPVYSEGLFRMFKNSIGTVDKKLSVGIYCPLEVCQRREVDRQDRAIGIAAKQFESIHLYVEYDFKVDTSKNSAAELSLLIVDKIKNL